MMLDSVARLFTLDLIGSPRGRARGSQKNEYYLVGDLSQFPWEVQPQSWMV